VRLVEEGRAAGRIDEYDPTAIFDYQPAYHLVDGLDAVSILTSLGCPFRCTYCASRRLWPVFFQRPPALVVAEVEALHKRFKVRDVAFYDDALLANFHDHLGPILSAIRQQSPRLRLHTPNGLHPRYITPEVARELHASGFETLRLSLETIDPARGKDSGGKVTPEQFERALKNLRAAGFADRQLETYVLVGLPGQIPDEIVDTMLFVHGLGARIKTAQYSPVPGTTDFERAAAEVPALREEPLLHNNSILPLRRSLTYEDLGRIKSLRQMLNHALDEGINVMGTDRISRALRRNIVKREKGMEAAP